MDPEYDIHRRRYSLCRTGFGLIAFSIGLLCLDCGCWLAFFASGNPQIHRVLDSQAWTWAVGAPITWASLIGSYLLWGRWTEAVWQRRVGLLVLMNFVDLLTWFLRHRDLFGSNAGPFPHDWLIGQVTQCLGWAELLIIGDLASDLIVHFKDDKPPEISRTTRTISKIGLFLAGMIFVSQADWRLWPLQPVRTTPLFIILHLGSLLLLTMTSFQVTILCFLASKHCRQYVAVLDTAESQHELLRSRSESDDAWS